MSEPENLLVKATEYRAGGYTDTGAFGVPDTQRQLLYYGRDMKLVAVAPFIGYGETGDGIKYPRFGKPEPVKSAILEAFKGRPLETDGP